MNRLRQLLDVVTLANLLLTGGTHQVTRAAQADNGETNIPYTPPPVWINSSSATILAGRKRPA